MHGTLQNKLRAHARVVIIIIDKTTIFQLSFKSSQITNIESLTCVTSKTQIENF